MNTFDRKCVLGVKGISTARFYNGSNFTENGHISSDGFKLGTKTKPDAKMISRRMFVVC